MIVLSNSVLPAITGLSATSNSSNSSMVIVISDLKLSEFSKSQQSGWPGRKLKLSNFSYALEEKSEMSDLENTDFSDENFQISHVSKFSNFLAFSEK